MAVQYLLPLRFLHSNRNSLLFGVSSRNPQRSSTFTSKSSPSLSLSSDREESRWVREEQRWIREEQRWIREEKRWNSERVSLLRQIDFLTTQLERPRQHRDSTKDDYDERKSKHSPLEMEDVKQMVVAARVKEEEVKEPRSLKMGSEGDDLIDVSEQQDDYDWKSKHPLLEVEEDAKEVEVEAKERRSLRVGSEGDDVRELQEALQKLGYYSGEEDMEFSSFSTGTERAVKTWQSTLGVHEDGVMSSQLLERLFTGRENDDSQIESDQTINKLGSLNGVPLVVSIPKIAGTQQSLIKDGGVEDDVTKSRVFLLGENRWEEPSRLVKSVKRTKESNPTTTSAKCLTCRGEGRLMCVECDGTGEPNIEPQFLEWVGEETKCPYCDGLGYIICDACQG